MPIYEYRCTACGHLLEAFQKITEEPLTVCPNCHKSTLNKLVSTTSFQLKGTGWYKTDFSNKGKPKDNPESTTETNSKTSKSETPDSASKGKTSDKSGSKSSAE